MDFMGADPFAVRQWDIGASFSFTAPIVTISRKTAMNYFKPESDFAPGSPARAERWDQARSAKRTLAARKGSIKRVEN
jgi:hypothetical protein